MATQSPATFSVPVERAEQWLSEIVSIKSVNKEPTTGHLWMTKRLTELGFTVQHFNVEGMKTPLVLGTLEGTGDGPGVLFDCHYDTVHARAEDWSSDPYKARVEDGVLWGRGAVDSKGSLVAMLLGIEAYLATNPERSGPLFVMSDSDGEDGFRGAVLMEDAGVRARVGTIFSAEATSNVGVEIAYPGISAWKITAIGKMAHPTEPENGINAIVKMGKLVEAVNSDRLKLPEGDSEWFKPRVATNAIRTSGGGGWVIPGRCDAVLSIMTGKGTTVGEIGDAIGAFLRELEAEDGEVKFEHKVLPMGAGRLWLRPAECDKDHEGVAALVQAVSEQTSNTPEVRHFNGGWVDGAELMRDGSPACITFGPGDFELAHQVDEHISLAEVAEAAGVYARAAQLLLAS